MHFINYNKPNQYQDCLQQVSKILLQWDADKIVPVHGFGAKINGQTNHCFPMFQGEGVFEMNGIMDTYKQFVHGNFMTLSGPTNFAPTLRMVNKQAREASQMD